MKKYLQRGFTLIELLVVIAIIGILSSIVLASLSTARNKAKDATVQGQLSNMRAAAEVYYSTNSKYQTTGVAIATCNGANSVFADTGSNMKGLIDATTIANGQAAGTYTNMDCGVTAAGDAWSVAAKLPSGAGFFCVDSTGASRNQTSTGVLLASLTGAQASGGAHAVAGGTACQ